MADAAMEWEHGESEKVLRPAEMVGREFEGEETQDAAEKGAEGGTTKMRKAWSVEEDNILRSLVEEKGAQGWGDIATSLPGRSGKSCRLRWFNHLHPQVVKLPFTEEEDRQLVLGYAKHGAKWAKISRHMPGRTDGGIKNRWHSHLKKRYTALLATYGSHDEGATDDSSSPAAGESEGKQQPLSIDDWAPFLDDSVSIQDSPSASREAHGAASPAIAEDLAAAQIGGVPFSFSLPSLRCAATDRSSSDGFGLPPLIATRLPSLTSPTSSFSEATTCTSAALLRSCSSFSGLPCGVDDQLSMDTSFGCPMLGETWIVEDANQPQQTGQQPHHSGEAAEKDEFPFETMWKKAITEARMAEESSCETSNAIRHSREVRLLAGLKHARGGFPQSCLPVSPASPIPQVGSTQRAEFLAPSPRFGVTNTAQQDDFKLLQTALLEDLLLADQDFIDNDVPLLAASGALSDEVISGLAKFGPMLNPALKACNARRTPAASTPPAGSALKGEPIARRRNLRRQLSSNASDEDPLESRLIERYAKSIRDSIDRNRTLNSAALDACWQGGMQQKSLLGVRKQCSDPSADLDSPSKIRKGEGYGCCCHCSSSPSPPSSSSGSPPAPHPAQTSSDSSFWKHLVKVCSGNESSGRSLAALFDDEDWL